MSGRERSSPTVVDAARTRTVDVDGVPTRVLETGAGDPLVLVHGGDFGSHYALDAWGPVVAPLARRFRVVAFDKLGQGGTGAPLRDEDYSPAGLCRHARGVLRELGLGPAHLVGHSMGAWLCARLVLDDPATARSLVVVDSNTLAPDDDRYPWRAFYRDLACRLPPPGPDGFPTEAAVRLEPEAQSADPSHVTPAFVEALLEHARRPSLHAAKSRRDALLDSVWLPSLQASRERTVAELRERGSPVPTLVLWGADDPSAPLPLAHALRELLQPRTPRLELQVIPDAGHYVFREQPALFARLVSGFCESVSGERETRWET